MQQDLPAKIDTVAAVSLSDEIEADERDAAEDAPDPSRTSSVLRRSAGSSSVGVPPTDGVGGSKLSSGGRDSETANGSFTSNRKSGGGGGPFSERTALAKVVSAATDMRLEGSERRLLPARRSGRGSGLRRTRTLETRLGSRPNGRRRPPCGTVQLTVVWPFSAEWSSSGAVPAAATDATKAPRPKEEEAEGEPAATATATAGVQADRR